MNFRTIAFVASGLALTVACGGGQPEPSTPPPASSAPAPAASAAEAPAASAAPAPTAAAAPSAAPAASAEPDAGAPPAPKSWKEMSHEERVALMKTQVLPKMKAAFQAQDPKDFADFTCVTCHGEGIKKGKADMPNPKLPKLNAKDGFKKETAKHPAMMKFMEETVEPTMATILGLPKWEPTNPGGFGCGNCHVVQM